MTKLSVPHPQGHLILSIAEAEVLRTALDKAIDHAKAQYEGLRPPQRENEKYLDRNSLYDFFVQIYPEGAALRNHAGKLFAHIVRAAMDVNSGVAFNVVHGECGKHVSNDCRNHRHYYTNDGSFLVEAKSLSLYAEEFIANNRRPITPTMSNDFQLLLANL